MAVSCATTMKTSKTEFQWSIEDTWFTKTSGIKNTLRSDTFTTGCNYNLTTWALEVERDDKRLSFKLVLVESAKPKVFFKAKFCILNTRNEQLYDDKKTLKFIPTNNDNYWKPNTLDSTSKLLEESDILFFRDGLKVYCRVIEIVEKITMDSVLKLPHPQTYLRDDYRRLFESKEGADVTIIVAEEEIKAHKSVLIARSPTFAEIFEFNSVAKNENKIHIEDMNPSVCNKMLEFIYTAAIEYIYDDMLGAVINAAIRYELKGILESFASVDYKKINVDNVVMFFVLAHRFKLEKLFKYTILFINSHRDSVMKTTGFLDLKEHDPLMIAEILYQQSMPNDHPKI